MKNGFGTGHCTGVKLNSIKKFEILKKTFLFFFAVVIVSSCANQKNVTYFQRAPGSHDTIVLPPAYIPRIQPDDLLSIPINSLSPAASSFFNPYAGGNNSQDATTAIGTDFDANSATRLARDGALGYRVDANGMIEIPLIGQIKVQGLTTNEARDLIKGKLVGLLKEPVVSVRFLNFKISVMGEVNRPSSYVIPNEKVTLPEAITLAGDLTIFGKRTNIMIIREVDGKKEFGYVDLSKRDVFTSPYYYLHPNDIVYVEPIKARAAATDRTNVYLPIIFSALSLIVVLVQYVHIK